MSEIPAPHDVVPQTDFASQYARTFEAAECRTQVELARILEVRQSSISDAKRRQSVPSVWLVKLFERKLINPMWIRTGLGGKTVETTDDGGVKISLIPVVERRPMEDCSTDELFAEIIRRASTIARYGA